MRSRLFVLALLAACKRDPGGNGAYGALPDAHVKFTADGDGPTNELTLQPLAAGTRASNGRNWDRWPGAVDAGRDDVLLHDASGGNSLWAPNLGSGVGLYRGTRDGVVVHALDAPLDDEVWPVLMVPETVRLGMTWESEYRDGGVTRSTVHLCSGRPTSSWSNKTRRAWSLGSSPSRSPACCRSRST